MPSPPRMPSSQANLMLPVSQESLMISDLQSWSISRNWEAVGYHAQKVICGSHLSWTCYRVSSPKGTDTHMLTLTKQYTHPNAEVCTHTHVCIHPHTMISTHISVHTHPAICTFTHKYVHILTCSDVNTHQHPEICTYTQVCTHPHTCTCTYTLRYVHTPYVCTHIGWIHRLHMHRCRSEHAHTEPWVYIIQTEALLHKCAYTHGLHTCMLIYHTGISTHSYAYTITFIFPSGKWAWVGFVGLLKVAN